jgi:hypothetical protein
MIDDEKIKLPRRLIERSISEIFERAFFPCNLTPGNRS